MCGTVVKSLEQYEGKSTYLEWNIGSHSNNFGQMVLKCRRFKKREEDLLNDFQRNCLSMIIRTRLTDCISNSRL